MKKNIAVVMGGYSSELEISMQSGQVVIDHLDAKKYHVYAVHILKNKWFVRFNGKDFTINKSNFSVEINGKKHFFDCVFNAIHGNPSENGKLVAYFELLGIKHTTSSFYQMALTFNKRDTLSVLKHYGIKCAKSVYINKGDEINFDYLIKKLKLPCFVKPNCAGSSFGISKVYKKENLQKAIDYAFSESNEILIESFLNGTEVSVGVHNFGNKIAVLAMTEIVSENDFFDFEAKYKGKSNEITPARITNIEIKKLKSVSEKIYKILNMSGVTRSDFILIKGEPYFIEINTVPGLSTESIVPKQAIEAGFTLTEFFGLCIENS